LLAIAGVLGAVSLAGIFVVYLVNTIGDNGNNTSSAQVVGTTNGGGTRGPSGPTGTAPPVGAAAPKPTTATPTPATPTPGKPAKNGNPNALNLIPKNQQFVTFTNRSAGYSILYPKGWKQEGSGTDVRFTHNNDLLRVSILKGPPTTVPIMRSNIQRNPAISLAKSPGNPGRTSVAGSTAIHATVLQNAILQQTPKGAIRLVLDLYRVPRKGKIAAIDLGTPSRVRPKNLDDYTKIVNSFRWL
jgi:hypothetical protein